MDNIETVVEALKLIITITSLIATAIAAKYGFKNKKLKRYAENAIAVANYVEKFIREAEGLIGFLGHMKKEWVSNKVHGVCLQKGIPYDSSQVSKLIEEKVELTKVVNPRPDQIVKVSPTLHDPAPR